MSFMSWNCRGLGNQTAIRVLVDLIHAKKPSVLFLMETLIDARRMEVIRVKLGFSGMFVVDNIGHSGVLAMLWKEDFDLQITSYSRNHIDTTVSVDAGRPKWRYTGFYGMPGRNRRRESWQLLRTLSSMNDLPCVVMGDFNDLMFREEKRGGRPHPEYLLHGFRDVVEECGLQNLPFEGNQFTWEHSRGSPNWIEEKLDRILTNTSWLQIYGGVKAASVVCSYSDHLPLMLLPVSTVYRPKKKRFGPVY